MRHRFERIAIALAVGIIASQLTACATPKAAAKANTDDLHFAPADVPSGVMESCTIIDRETEVAGQKVMAISGGQGAFVLVLPVANDWKFQCDGKRFFWGLSPNSRMQVSVNPYRPQANEDVTPRNYLEAIAANNKQGLASHGVRVTKSVVAPVFKDASGEILVLESTVDAPPGEHWPLLPQDSFVSARQGPAGYMFDAHITTYYRDSVEQAALRSTARWLMTAFTAHAGQPPAHVDERGGRPLPSIPGVSVTSFSDKTITAMKAALNCQGEKMARYCDALDRFAKARPVSKAENTVWAGSTLMAFAGSAGKVDGAVEDIHHLYVRNGRASFNAIKPSDEGEATELRSMLEQLHSGKAPSRESGLMRYLSTFTPAETNPVETVANCLSFAMGDSGLNEESLPPALRTMPPSKVFVRENQKELIAVEVWGEGHLVMVGIFPKG